MSVIEDAIQEFVEIVTRVTGTDASKVAQEVTFSNREEFGDLSVALPSLGVKDVQALPENLQGKKFVRLVKKEKVYYNAYLDEKEIFKSLFQNLSEFYGITKVDNPKYIIVEHTSANPIHPLHIGHMRNAILGDIISRMLSCRGHKVERRFYVNDAGRQVAILTYGYIKLNKPDPPVGVKADSWLGFIYSVTNIVLEIRKIKGELNSADESRRAELIKRLDELVAAAANLESRDRETFYRLVDAINSDPDPEKSIADIVRKYESGTDKEIVSIVRKLVDLALKGFQESLDKLSVKFDGFDYESDLLWRGEVQKVIEEMMSSPYRITYKDTLALEVNVQDERVRDALEIPKGLELPPLVIMRSDGTSLYTTRDVAYTLYKFSRGAEVVINVIAEQQSVPQMQLRAALYLLGHKREAENLFHYSYAMVSLQGSKMSGRLGKYVSLDEVYELVKASVEQKINEKGGNREVIPEITSGAIRYAIASVSANKQLNFNVKTVTDFEQNSGPYLQYTYARAYNILDKANEEPSVSEADPNYIKGDWRKLLILIAKFPVVMKKACDELRPEDLVAYLREVADVFNKVYNYERVLQEPDRGKRFTKLLIVKGVERVLHNGLSVLGITPLKRM
jgi:arginyl-tRNA synthetase